MKGWGEDDHREDKLFEWSYQSDMIHDEQENYALGTVSIVHVDWDTNVNPTQTGY